MNLKKEGLLVEPQFDNLALYLEEGEVTSIGDYIERVSATINGHTDGMVLRNILLWIHNNTKRINDLGDKRKFTRTAEEILISGERTGCCDSSTLFTALARAKGLPTMQIITLSKSWGDRVDKGESCGVQGHYFNGCHLGDINGNSNWYILDPDREVKDVRDVMFMELDTNNRNIGQSFYAFAYVRDYRDVKLNGLCIDSHQNMGAIQLEAYKQSDRNDFHMVNRDNYK